MKQPQSPLPFKQNTWDIIIYNESKNEYESIFDPRDRMLDNLKDCAYIVEASNNYPKAVDLLRQVLAGKNDTAIIELFLKEIDAIDESEDQIFTSNFNIRLKGFESAKHFKNVFPRFCKSLDVECTITTKKRLLPWKPINATLSISGARLNIKKASLAIEWLL